MVNMTIKSDSQQIKVLIVDDHVLVGKGIAAILKEMHDMRVIAVCNCGEQAIKIIDGELPDVIVMDINMPGIGGVEACRRVLKNFPEIKLIGLSIFDNSQLPQQLFKIGVAGFVSKAAPVEDMVHAIRIVMSGKKWVYPDLDPILNTEATPFNKLSQRESEVVQFILKGNSIKQMSTALQLNTKTINTYRYRLYNKLKIKNDVELTLLASEFNYYN